MATLSVPIVSPSQDIQAIRQKITAQPFECLSQIIVCEDYLFRGLIRIEDLYVAKEESVAKDIMDRNPPLIKPGTDIEIAAWTAVKHKESALAVLVFEMPRPTEY